MEEPHRGGCRVTIEADVTEATVPGQAAPADDQVTEEATPTPADLERRVSEARAHAAKLEADGAPAADIRKAKARARQYAEEVKATKSAAKAEREQARKRSRRGGSRPVIDVTSEPDAVQAIIDVLESGRIPDVYLYGAGPAQVGRDATGPTFVPLDPNGLTLTFISQAEVIKIRVTNDGDEIPTSVLLPPRIASVALAKTRWDLPVLKGISSVPLLLPDGTFQLRPGFHEKTGYFYEPRHILPEVPANPTNEEIGKARALIMDKLLADFPWQTKADKASYLATLFFAPLRVLVDDPMPVFMLSATNPGSGKSLLVTILDSLYGAGRSTWATDNSEMGKVVTSVLTGTANPVVIFDNLPNGHTVRFPVLSELATARTWNARILGQSRMANVPNGRLWIVNGNNLGTGDDMARRVIWSVLDPAMRPDLRDANSFELGDLDQWLPDHAADVLHAVLVLLAGWAARGMPRSSHSIASFGAWPSVLGGILNFLKVDGWLESREEHMQDGDEDSQEWGAFLSRWHKEFGSGEVTSKTVLEAAQPVPDPYGGSQPGPLSDVAPREAGKFLPNPIKLGLWLKARNGRHFGEYRLQRRVDGHTKVTWWHVEYNPVAAAAPPPATGQPTLTT
jgi:hypothetical protein